MTAIDDTFDRANSASLGTSSDGDWSWTEVEDLLELLTNQANNTASGQFSARAEKDLATSDMVAEADMTVAVSNSRGGVAVRYQPGATTYYRGAVNRVSGGDDDFEIGKVIAGVFTSLATATVGGELGSARIRLQIVGSTLTLFCDGTPKLVVVDTSIASGTRAGIAGVSAGGSRIQWNNFHAEDVAVGFRQSPAASSFRMMPAANSFRTQPVSA